jgi:hypothetical protein
LTELTKELRELELRRTLILNEVDPDWWHGSCLNGPAGPGELGGTKQQVGPSGSDELALPESLIQNIDRQSRLLRGQIDHLRQKTAATSEPQFANLPIPNRKEAVEGYCKSRGIKKAVLYRKATVDSSDYYRWERGKLPVDSAVDVKIRRVLSE